MRASLIQIAVNEDESVESRRRRVASLVGDQAGCRPRRPAGAVDHGAFAYEEFGREAEPLEGPTYEAMAKAASDAGVWLHAGSIPERDPDGPLYNTSLVFSPSGDLAAAYRKIHRFGFDKGEAVLMGAGARAGDGPSAGDHALGLATCYDLRFPELFRGLVDAGAETLVVSAGWPERRRAHWTLLAQARAVENQAFVARLRNGRDARRSSAGRSLDRGRSLGRGAGARPAPARRSSRWSSTRGRSRRPGSSSRR